MTKINHRNGKNNGHIPGTTLIGRSCFVVAYEAVPSVLPPEESGSDHHFHRPLGDFVRVESVKDDHFVGCWVQGMTVALGNNKLKLFPRGKTRLLRAEEIGCLVEIISALNAPSQSRVGSLLQGS